jgi:hypothetical protein
MYNSFISQSPNQDDDFLRVWENDDMSVDSSNTANSPNSFVMHLWGPSSSNSRSTISTLPNVRSNVSSIGSFNNTVFNDNVGDDFGRSGRLGMSAFNTSHENGESGRFRLSALESPPENRPTGRLGTGDHLGESGRLTMSALESESPESRSNEGNSSNRSPFSPRTPTTPNRSRRVNNGSPPRMAPRRGVNNTPPELDITGGKWTRKYKKSINCKKPKGFSQKQYCKYGKKLKK